ncbi:hypothetical protein RXV86_10745 [Alisedimentitalea sp. MJ-SS2]|uniref:hypothetical protein n=1 Tax=Aliisedimentitalea sp. MJ-SS2 TaxID=3049795 RepID=UPI00290C3B11|nr:hypothetical protein [Alisedimentitalea sp. MJ-SS2]MDU8927861.1 hypothetical protein [Alisedimentitalea sp. MJ-SS2]
MTRFATPGSFESYDRMEVKAIRQALEDAGQAMTTGTPSTFDGGDMMRVVGCDMTAAAEQV